MKYIILLLILSQQLNAVEDKLKFSASILAAASKTDEISDYMFLHSINIMYSKKHSESDYYCHLSDRTTNNACEEKGENNSMYADALSFDYFEATTRKKGTKLNCDVEYLENNLFKLTANKKINEVEWNYVFTFDSLNNVKDFEGQLKSHGNDVMINLVPIPSNGKKDSHTPISKIPTDCKNIVFYNSFKGKK